jgi:hypothetical protein
VPSLGAAVVASVAGWVIASLVQPYLGTGAGLVLSFVLSTVAFFATRQWLRDLRGR